MKWHEGIFSYSFCLLKIEFFLNKSAFAAVHFLSFDNDESFIFGDKHFL